MTRGILPLILICFFAGFDVVGQIPVKKKKKRPSYLAPSMFEDSVIVSGPHLEEEPDVKDRYLSIQTNQLIRQVFNISGANNSVINNPFMLGYASNSQKTGWGFNSGVGYYLTTRLTHPSPGWQSLNTVDYFALRFGTDRKFKIADRWIFSSGFDLIFGRLNDETRTLEPSFDNAQRETIGTERKKYFGFGPRLTLSFFITKRILIGSEMNCYLKFTNNHHEFVTNATTVFTDSFTGQVVVQKTSSVDSNDRTSSNVSLNLPVSVFISVKF